MNQAVQAWRQPVVVQALNQAFPELGQTRQFKDKQVIFNHDRSRVFGVVSKRYNVVDHAKLIEMFSESYKTAFGQDPSVTVHEAAHGARIMAEIELPFVAPVEVAVGDMVQFRINLFNSHDSMWKFQARLMGYRLMCKNGLLASEEYGAIGGKHFAHLGDVTAQAKALEEMVKKAVDLGKVWKTWTGEQVTFAWAKKHIAKLFPKKLTETVLVEDKFPRSKWDFYNDLTAATTHNTKSLTRRVELDGILARTFYA